MKEMAKELKQVQATQQRDHAMRSLMFLMKNYGSEVEEKQQRKKQELSNKAEALPEASRLRGQGIAGRTARTLSSMQQVIAGKKATAECDGGSQREADSTEKMRSLMFLMKNYGSEVEEKQQRKKQELSNEAEALPEASRLRGQGLAGRIARTLSSMQQVIAGKKATAECDGGSQREADSTEKQQLKEPLEQHYEQHMDAEQDSEGAHRHTDGAESKWRMVPEKEADAQTFDVQISEIHTAEYRAATLSTTEMVHGRAREPPRQTWCVAVDEGRLRVLVVLVGVLAIVMVAANCERKAAEGCIWHNAVSLIFLMIWHAVVVLTRVAWMGSWLWKQDPKLHDITWAFETIMSLWHLSTLLTVLDHLVVYEGFLS